MVYYRSDWPEAGLPKALNEQRLVAFTNRDRGWVEETQISGVTFRWVASQSEFESNLYGFPMWSFRLEIDDADSDMLTARPDGARLREYVNEIVRKLLDVSPWDAACVYSKVVKDEPLHTALLQIGFEEVEYRRLYTCKIRDITSKPPSSSARIIQLASLATITPERLSYYREHILEICREAFVVGYSRHFTDPALSNQLSGIKYILAAMKLNFEHVLPHHFLVAVDTDSGQVCGFSAIGRKPGLAEDVYTQLLSAVRKTYRGQRIYRGLTHLLSKTLPGDATLLNVTHVDNRAIQRAYQDSGRVHLADTVVLRRVFL